MTLILLYLIKWANGGNLTPPIDKEYNILANDKIVHGSKFYLQNCPLYIFSLSLSPKNVYMPPITQKWFHDLGLQYSFSLSILLSARLACGVVIKCMHIFMETSYQCHMIHIHHHSYY